MPQLLHSGKTISVQFLPILHHTNRGTHTGLLSFFAEQMKGGSNGQPITRAEHEEFRRRLEEENARQDRRIALLEDNVSKMGALSTSVEKLALSMESMVKEQEKQGKRLETLESRDGEMWRKAVGYVVTAIIGVFLGYVFTQLGF
jgi:hypothetical protein